MKKALRYFQNQALQYSDEKYNSAAYLSPRRNHEPQQQHHSKHLDSNNDIKPLFSTATTAVNPPPYQSRRPDPPTHHSSSSPSRGSRKLPPTPPRISAHIQRIQYASDHIRQSYELYLYPPPSSVASLPTSSSSSSISSSSATASNASDVSPPQTSNPLPPAPHSAREQYFIIYIPSSGHMHDPSITASSFHPTLSLLTAPQPSSLNPTPSIRGSISINYRLASPSSPPSPQPSSDTPYSTDAATFPDALTDILLALTHIQTRFPSLRDTGRYLLVGHGFGALLALNALTHMRERGVTPPRAVVGVNGVYDLAMLHRERREFEALSRRILPEEEGRWGGEEGVSAVGWSGGRWREVCGPRGQARQTNPLLLLLAHSREDRLVGFAQAEALKNVLGSEGVTGDGNNPDGTAREDETRSQIACEILEIGGRHNECWETGRELARAITEGMERVRSLDGCP